ncbi:MAG TPA: DNA-processing protein DprA [Candidatus Paceibacterota bacterium]|nr:DNA-processing protein DprA [Candidatus Paceibacterota bacterium]
MTSLIRQLPPEEFPELLTEIPGKPKRLYIRGSLPSRDYIYLCVVGSRATTPYGRRMCQSLIAGLARYPVAIVSGMALGIDSEAHKAALDVGLPTVAVLPSSADDASLYPSSNKALAARILARGGALLSEYKTPFKAAQYSFAQRNRVMAGMSKATLIVEAGEKSGTLITSRLALDFNREVLCVPHELGRETGEGANRLIREGATLVRDSADILQALGIKADGPEQAALPTDLTDVEAKILETLTQALVRDEVIEAAELSAQDANIALSSLLIRGLIVERLGKIERV